MFIYLFNIYSIICIHFIKFNLVRHKVDAYFNNAGVLFKMALSRLESLSWWFAWCSGLSAIYLVYYLTAVVARPTVVCSGKRLRAAVVEHCPIFFELYWPSVWACNNHLMTIIRSKLQQSPRIQYKRYTAALLT